MEVIKSTKTNNTARWYDASECRPEWYEGIWIVAGDKAGNVESIIICEDVSTDEWWKEFAFENNICCWAHYCDVVSYPERTLERISQRKG